MPPVPSSQLATFADLSPVLVQILYNRGITDRKNVNSFLASPLQEVQDDKASSPFRLRGMSEAVTRIRHALKKGERITVYGDYDADGISATALLVETISALGGHVTPYIPSRSDTGYGLCVQPLDQIAQSGTTLLITVDCGIRDVAEVRHATQIGLDVIVTDHHTVGDALPPALAIINPKQAGCKYPFRELCGAGVAFKLAQGLLRVENQVPINRRHRDIVEEDLLDLVALGTVADLVPLEGENRFLVARGLTQLRNTRRPGLQQLIQLAGLKQSLVNSEDISYRLGPRINAAGRLANPLDGYRLLVVSDEDEAEQLAAQLNALNRTRQEMTRQMVELALTKLDDSTADILIVHDEQFSEGLLGLVAGQLTDRFYRPAVAIVVGAETSRGSARSIPEFNITKALDACKHRLIRHGGHAMAGGFTVATEELFRFKADLEALATQLLTDRDLHPTLVIDADVSLEMATRDLCTELLKLAPFGYGNKVPVLASHAVHVSRHFRVGARGEHLKLQLSVPGTSSDWDAIAFRQGDWDDHLPSVIDVAYHLELNHWNNRERLQLNVQDLRPAQ